MNAQYQTKISGFAETSINTSNKVSQQSLTGQGIGPLLGIFLPF